MTDLLQLEQVKEEDVVVGVEFDNEAATADQAGRCTSILSVRQKKAGLLIFSLMYIPLFAGAFYGFGPMQIMLEETGAFASVCDNSVDNTTVTKEGVCADQTARLLTVSFIGQLMILSSPVLGVMVDRFGPVALASLLGFCGSFGAAMLLAAVIIPKDNLLFLAFISMGLMATASSIMTVKTGMVFADEVPAKTDDDEQSDDASASSKREQKTQSRVISVLNTFFDAGSVTYLGLWGISELGLSIPDVFAIYLALAVFCFGGAIFFWISLGEKAVPKIQTILQEKILDTTGSSSFAANKDKSTLQPRETGSAKGDCAYCTSIPDYILVCDRTPKKQLLSLPLIMLLIFFAINVSRTQFVLTTARDFLAYLGDEETSEKYLSIFTLLMPASILGLPFADQVIARYGYHAGFQIVCLLAAIHGIIQVSCDKLNGIQILGFVVFSFYRCFLFSITFSYLPTLLGSDVVGKGIGAMHLTGGAFSFLNIPLSSVTVTKLNGNFFVPNLIYTLLVIPCSLAAFVIGKSIQRERLAKEKSKSTRGHTSSD